MDALRGCAAEPCVRPETYMTVLEESSGGDMSWLLREGERKTPDSEVGDWRAYEAEAGEPEMSLLASIVCKVVTPA